MPSSFKNSFYLGLVLALFLGLWLARLWPAENQVRLHSENFLHQIETRNANRAGDFVAPDYHDVWGHDRALLLERLRLTLRFFSSLAITTSASRVTVEAPAAIWQAKIQLAGAGGEMAPVILGRVNELAAPFELRWRHESWRPWDWKLVEIKNPSLDLAREIY